MDKIKFNNQIDLYIDQNWNKIDKKYKHRIANTQRFKLTLEYLVNIKNKNLLESIRYLYKKYQISFGLQFEKIIDEKFLPLELLQFSTKQERLEYLKGKLHKCKICGKWTSNDTYCSIKCASNDELVKNKIKMTTFKHLGVYTSSQSKEIQEKSRNTKIKKYGDPNYTNLKKRQETNLKKYGCTNALNSNEIKEKSIKTCIKKYGTNCYMKSKDFIRKSRETLRNKYGVFNNYYISKKEIDLFECLNCRKIHNDRDLIFPLELDIVLPDYKLAIEYNGVYWHSSKNKDKAYHLNKTLHCLKNNYQLFHIFENENIEIWKSIINNKLKLNNKICARKCILKYVNCEDAKNFLNNNHLEGYKNSDVNIGLYFDEKLVQIMTFTKENDKYILNQFCSLLNTTVVGGCSKLFNYFIKTYKPLNILTICDLRYSLGNIYKILGFKFIKSIEPQLQNIEYNNKKYNIYNCGYLIYEWKNNI